MQDAPEHHDMQHDANGREADSSIAHSSLKQASREDSGCQKPVDPALPKLHADP